MATKRVKFSSQATPDLLAGMREIAASEGRHFQSVLEDAMRSYLESHSQQKVRPVVLGHYKASLERNRQLIKLLADS